MGSGKPQDGHNNFSFRAQELALKKRDVLTTSFYRSFTHRTTNRIVKSVAIILNIIDQNMDGNKESELTSSREGFRQSKDTETNFKCHQSFLVVIKKIPKED